MKIDKAKLTALHEYLVAGGSSEQEDVAAQLGVPADDETTTEAYVEALKAEWPAVYGEPAAPAPAPKPAAKKAAKQSKNEAPPIMIYRLRRLDGTVTALEVVASRNGTVVLEEPRPKDEVEIILRGKPVVVDLIKLRGQRAGSMFLDVPVAKVIEMAELAKA